MINQNVLNKYRAPWCLGISLTQISFKYLASMQMRKTGIIPNLTTLK